jgi:hypothetical protein
MEVAARRDGRARSLVVVTWDLWVDYHRIDGAGLTHANGRNAEPGVELQQGIYVVVGNEDADPAMAEVVTVEPGGLVLVRVLSGPVGDHAALGARA